jgi:hypothetical protein
MKKIILIALALLFSPVHASVNCLANSQHLQESYDDKEWHSVACNCPCTLIKKNNHCFDCDHLQNASTYVVVLPTKIALNNTQKIYKPQNPQTIIQKLVLKYIQKK